LGNGFQKDEKNWRRVQNLSFAADWVRAIQNIAPVLDSAYGKFQIPLLTWLQCTDNQEIAPNRYFSEGAK
jgi:hypothetical protein